MHVKSCPSSRFLVVSCRVIQIGTVLYLESLQLSKGRAITSGLELAGFSASNHGLDTVVAATLRFHLFNGIIWHVAEAHGPQQA